MGKIRILLVEDSKAYSSLLRRRLKGDYAFAVADSLRECVRVVREAADPSKLISDDPPFDVIFLDLGLPDSTGMQTLIKVAQHSWSIPIIVLTGSSDDPVKAGEQAISAGAQSYISKDDIADNIALLKERMTYAIARGQFRREMSIQMERYRQAMKALQELAFDLWMENIRQAAKFHQASKFAEEPMTEQEKAMAEILKISERLIKGDLDIEELP